MPRPDDRWAVLVPDEFYRRLAAATDTDREHVERLLQSMGAYLPPRIVIEVHPDTLARCQAAASAYGHARPLP